MVQSQIDSLISSFSPPPPPANAAILKQLVLHPVGEGATQRSPLHTGTFILFPKGKSTWTCYSKIVHAHPCGRRVWNKIQEIGLDLSASATAKPTAFPDVILPYCHPIASLFCPAPALPNFPHHPTSHQINDNPPVHKEGGGSSFPSRAVSST